MAKLAWGSVAIGLLLMLSGCSSEAALPPVDLAELRSRILLAEEPAGVLPVLAAIDSIPSGEREVVVLGRIGGMAKPCDDVRAVFVMVDPSVDAAVGNSDHACGDGCKFCKQSKTAAPPLAIVQLVDDSGQAVPVSARQLLDVSPEQMVVVRGRAKVDPLGNLAVVADGLYIRR